MKSTIFREYDIRGIVGKEFSVDESYDIAKSITTYFLNNAKISKVIVAMDGRSHSADIKANVIQAITEMGVDVVDIGVCPTPVFYFSLFNSETTSGLIITASHNPKEYNGFKICLKQKSVWGDSIQQIRKICEEKRFHTSNTIGTVYFEDFIEKYIDWMANNFPHLEGMDIDSIIDCGNATSATVIPRLAKKMNWKNYKIVCSTLDGNFPNHEPDPTNIKNMQCVQKELVNFSLGIGLDGDSDRMNPMTPSELVAGDKLLFLYSQYMVKERPNAGVVFDIKSSLGLIEGLQSINAKPYMSPSGHSLVKNSMIENNALLAGELSCHFFFKDRYFGYDDGIYAMLRLFEIIKTTGKNLDELLSEFPKKISSNEIRIECDENKKTEIINGVKKFFSTKKCDEIISIDGIRTHMSYGWGLARASNTQSVISLRFEANDNEGLKKIKTDFGEALEPYFEKTKLENEFNQ